MSKRRGLDLPDEPGARTTIPDPPCVTAPLAAARPRRGRHRRGDLGHRLRRRFRLDRYPRHRCARAKPVHRSGITDVPGLYFLGLQWLSKLNSSFLSGVGDDAAVLADHIRAHR